MDAFYSVDQQQRRQQQGAGQPNPVSGINMSGAGPSNSPPAMPMMGSGETLDDFIANNQNDMYRRRSMPHAFNNAMAPPQDNRRLSSIGVGDMMTFGGGDADLGGFQFGQPMSAGYHAMDTTNMSMPDHMGNYMAVSNDYSPISTDMMGNVISNNFANMSMGSMGADPSSADMYAASGAMQATVPAPMPGQYNTNMLGSVNNDFSMDLSSDESSLGTNAVPNNDPLKTAADSSISPTSDDAMNVGQAFTSMDAALDPTRDANMDLGTGSMTMPAQSLVPSVPAFSRDVSSSSSAISPQRGASAVSTDPTTPATPRETAIYSKSGFDMLKALWLVATRKEPKIHLGAVDMSCAFVVCDVTQNDCPIIYVSDNFQNLTGYSRHEIVGQNCRFLQAPDGKVEAGSRREFVDDGAVYNLKKKIRDGEEVQQSLINYRKGGKPFLNLLTMIPIPWDTDEIRYIIGFQIDLVECPDAIAGQETGGVKVNYKHSDIGQYIWTPPPTSHWESENGQTLGLDDVSTLLQQFNPRGHVSDWHKQSWDKMLLENTDDVVHVLSLKGLFLYLSPSCKKVLEYDPGELAGSSLSSVCHPSDIVPVTRELKDATGGSQVNIVFRIRRKNSGYTWFESHGSLFVEQGKGRKCIILVGRKRPVFALSRRNLEEHGGIGDSELWTKLSTSGMFLFVSSNIRSLLDLQPEALVGTSIQELMRKESRADFGRAVEKARRGKTVTCKHEVQNRRGQVLQAQTTLFPGDASEGQKPSFLLAQTKLLKSSSSRGIAPARGPESVKSGDATPKADQSHAGNGNAYLSQAANGKLAPGSQDAALASDDNIFDELRTTKCSSWQFELRQMEKVNRILAEELGGLLSNKKKRKRRKGAGNTVRDCANCHTRNTPEWRRGPSGQRDLCNSCGLRWAKQTGRVSPRTSSRGGNGDSHSKKPASPGHMSPLSQEFSPKPHTAGGEGAINPAKLTNQTHYQAGSAASGAPSAIGTGQLSMPPPSQSSAAGGAGMSSIREERESSQL